MSLRKKVHLMMKLLAVMMLVVNWMVQPAVSQSINRTGSENPVNTSHLPGVVLAGGGRDNDDAMRWMLQRAQGGDVVVLRASGSDGYNDYFYSELGVKVNSVTSIVITSTAQANSEQVLDIVRQAEVVFIAGGNQWDYVRHWRGTKLLELLNELINEKRITIGGTSAGMAVLGEVLFSAENNTSWSSEALEDPFHERMKLVRDFLSIPHLPYTVTDSHYNRRQTDGRNRHGRHISFIARMVNDWQMPARGIAADENVAIAVDENGIARVFGDPSLMEQAFFLQAYDGAPEQCTAGNNLHWHRDQKAVKVYKVNGDNEGNNWFSLRDWVNGEGGTWEFWYVANGTLMKDQASPSGRWVRFEVRDAIDSTLVEGAWVGLGDPEAPSPSHHGNHTGKNPIHINDAATGNNLVPFAATTETTSHSPKQTPVFGMVNFANLNPALSYPYGVSKEGYFSWEGTADPGDNNLAIRAYLRRDDTSLPHVSPGANGKRNLLHTYPNPATDLLWIRLPESIVGEDNANWKDGRVQVSVFSADGRLVKTRWHDGFPGEAIPVNVGHLPAGLYLLQASAGSYSLVGRFIRR